MACGSDDRNDPLASDPIASSVVTLLATGARTEPVSAVTAGPSERDRSADPYNPVTPDGTERPLVR